MFVRTMTTNENIFFMFKNVFILILYQGLMRK